MAEAEYSPADQKGMEQSYSKAQNVVGFCGTTTTKTSTRTNPAMVAKTNSIMTLQSAQFPSTQIAPNPQASQSIFD